MLDIFTGSQTPETSNACAMPRWNTKLKSFFKRGAFDLSEIRIYFNQVVQHILTQSIFQAISYHLAKKALSVISTHYYVHCLYTMGYFPEQSPPYCGKQYFIQYQIHLCLF
jgi:hypothetical protein